MKNCRSLGRIAGVFIAVSLAVDDSEVWGQFVKLPVEARATQLALWADGTLLAVAHEEDNLVTVWDMATGEKKKSIETPSPTSIFCIGGPPSAGLDPSRYHRRIIHIADSRNDKVTSIQLDDGFVFASREIDGAYYLSWGGLEKGLLATCRGRGGDDRRLVRMSYPEKVVTGVDVKGYTLATYDCTGANLILQGRPTETPSSRLYGVYDSRAVSREPVLVSKDLALCAEAMPPALKQFRRGRYWFGVGARRLYQGTPPAPAHPEFSGVLVPDLAKELFYVCDGRRITCRALDVARTEVGTVELAAYPNLLADYSDPSQRPKGAKQEVPPHTLAVTLGGSLLIVGIDPEKGDVYRCQLPAFAVSAQVATSIKQHLGPQKDFPKQIPAGREFVLPIFGYELDGRYEVRNASRADLGDLSISKTGVLKWNPTEEQIGNQYFEININRHSKSNKHSYYVRLEVVDPARLSVAEGGTGEAVTFQSLPVGKTATTMTLSEDKTLLVVGHESDNKLTVWDVKTNKQLKEVACPAPRSILWRGKKVYVANFGKGTISVFDTQRDWRLADQLLAGRPEVTSLSAPQGEHFKGQMLTTCRETDQNDYRVFWIDAARDVPREVYRHPSRAAATVDYTGRQFLVQGGNYGSSIHEFKPPPENTTKLPQGTRVSDHLPSRRPVGESNYWFSNYQVYSGMQQDKGLPPRPIGSRPRVLIPDSSKNVYYTFDDGKLQCRQLDDRRTVQGERLVNFPSDSATFGTRDRSPPPGTYLGNGPPYHIAVSHGDELTFYVLDVMANALFICKTSAF